MLSPAQTFNLALDREIAACKAMNPVHAEIERLNGLVAVLVAAANAVVRTYGDEPTEYGPIKELRAVLKSFK